MMPERGVGVFVAFNTDSGARARGDFSPAFFDHYFTKPLPKEPPPPKDKRAGLARFAGTYFAARSSFSDASELARLMSAVKVSVDSDGYLAGSIGGDFSRWRQVEPLFFQQVDGKRRIVFREDGSGGIADFCSSPLCVNTMQKQPWWEGAGVQWTLLGVCLGMLVGGLIGIPIAAVLQRRQPRPGLSKVARTFVWTNCLIWTAGFVCVLTALQDAQTTIVFGIARMLQVAMGVLVAASVLTVGSALFGFLAWRRGWWRRAGRISLSLVILGGIGCILWLTHWNML